MHFSPENSVSPGAVLGCGNTTLDRSVERSGAPIERNEEAVFHLQRVEDSLATKFVQALTRHRFDDGTQHDEIQVSVDNRFSGLVNEGRANRSIDDEFVGLAGSDQRFSGLAFLLEQHFVVGAPGFEAG